MARAEVAAHVGIDVGTLSRYEAGDRTVPVIVARRMAKLYGRPNQKMLELCHCDPSPLLPRQPWCADDIPAVITALRTAAGMSKEALGRCLGRSGQAVRGWESGRTRPRPVMCRRLEAIFGLPFGSFPF